MTLKLEVGKTYVTADGTPVKIESQDKNSDWPFNGSDGDCYQADGRCDGVPCMRDLVAELQPPCSALHTDYDLQPSPVATQRAYFLDEMMLALVRGRVQDSPAEIADAFLALADARAKR